MLNLSSARPSAQLYASMRSPAASAATQDPSEPVLRVAVAAIVSPGDTFFSYRGMAEYLADRVGMRADLVLRSTYEEVNDLVGSGQVDVAFVCSGAYAAAAAGGKMSLLVAPVVGDASVYYADVIVPRSSQARGLEDLRGARFGYVDELSNSGYLAPRARLAELGLAPDSFFGESIFTHSHDKSIAAVAGGVVSAASVDSLVLDSMRERGDAGATQVRTIERLGPFGMPPVVVPSSLEAGLRESLLRVFLEMADTPQGQAILAPLRVDRFRVPAPSEYAELISSVEVRGGE